MPHKSNVKSCNLLSLHIDINQFNRFRLHVRLVFKLSLGDLDVVKQTSWSKQNSFIDSDDRVMMIECDVSLSSTDNTPVMGTDGNNGLSFQVGNTNYNSQNK